MRRISRERDVWKCMPLGVIDGINQSIAVDPGFFVSLSEVHGAFIFHT